MGIIKTKSLEIFKQNVYFPQDIGIVSNNAYLSIVVTNNCQMKCSYCINSETDHSLELPIDKAIDNIKNLVSKYLIKEAILLGGEPTLHTNLFELLKELRLNTGLEFIRLTTNGIKLKDKEFVSKLIDKNYGIQGLNISFHNEEFITFNELQSIYKNVKLINPDIKIRINTNIWKNNNDKLYKLVPFLDKISNISDEIRISNLIPKDNFSVNNINNDFIGFSVDEYNKYFDIICTHYSQNVTLIENEKTLGFVRYILIPTKTPIIINWNTSSTVSEQICENNIKTREINTFKCLVNGNISLSWNNNNIINI